jgi:hypothetical protein
MLRTKFIFFILPISKPGVVEIKQPFHHCVIYTISGHELGEVSFLFYNSEASLIENQTQLHDEYCFLYHYNAWYT